LEKRKLGKKKTYQASFYGRILSPVCGTICISVEKFKTLWQSLKA